MSDLEKSITQVRQHAALHRDDMTSRERVLNAMEFKPVDKVPLEYHASPAGLYEHGEKLRELFRSVEGDFEDYTGIDMPAPVWGFMCVM